MRKCRNSSFGDVSNYCFMVNRLQTAVLFLGHLSGKRAIKHYAVLVTPIRSATYFDAVKMFLSVVNISPYESHVLLL